MSMSQAHRILNDPEGWMFSSLRNIRLVVSCKLKDFEAHHPAMSDNTADSTIGVSIHGSLTQRFPSDTICSCSCAILYIKSVLEK